MTEKRFKYYMEDDEWVLVDTIEDAYYYFDTTENTMIALTNLLNALSKENEQLNLNIDEYKRVAKSVKEKNEQLKQQLADVDRLIDDLGHDEMRRQYEEIFKGDVE